jgi:serralysin
MIGGTGNDSYVVNSTGDIIQETSTLLTEMDSVKSTINYTLGANLENLELGSKAIEAVGNNLNNNLTGNASNNILTGNDGNDSLDGGTGSDTMNGGSGNDSYVVDNIGDIIQELGTLTTEKDTVKTFVSYTLGDNLENLTMGGTANLNATGNALANKLTGNAGNNLLDGGAAADTLIGGLGTDTLTGGTGADKFVFSSADDSGIGLLRDVITDFVKGQNDKVDISAIDANTTLDGNQAFAFVSSFSGTAGEVRFEGGIAYFNTDSDMDAEFEIELLGVSTMTNTDFIL